MNINNNSNIQVVKFNYPDQEVEQGLEIQAKLKLNFFDIVKNWMSRVFLKERIWIKIKDSSIESSQGKQEAFLKVSQIAKNLNLGKAEIANLQSIPLEIRKSYLESFLIKDPAKRYDLLLKKTDEAINELLIKYHSSLERDVPQQTSLLTKISELSNFRDKILLLKLNNKPAEEFLSRFEKDPDFSKKIKNGDLPPEIELKILENKSKILKSFEERVKQAYEKNSDTFQDIKNEYTQMKELFSVLETKYGDKLQRIERKLEKDPDFEKNFLNMVRDFSKNPDVTELTEKINTMKETYYGGQSGADESYSMLVTGFKIIKRDHRKHYNQFIKVKDQYYKQLEKEDLKAQIVIINNTIDFLKN